MTSLEKSDRDIQFRHLSAEQREQMMIQVAKRYYFLDRTLNQIAEELGLTRWQASKLLTEARDCGLVRIDIVPQSPRLPALEARLQAVYGLKDAVIVPVAGDAALMLDAVAGAAAGFIAGLGRLPLLGVSWGRTMNAVARRLPPFWNEGGEVVLVNGASHVRASGDAANNAADLFARACNGTATLLPVPAILGSAATRVALEQDPTIAAALDLGRQAPVVCFGIGAMGPESILLRSGYLSLAEERALAAKGAVGDVLGRFIGADGAIIDRELNDRTIGLDPAECRTRDLSIGIGTGPAKHAAIRACLLAKYINVLVTDEQTAHFLLSEQSQGNDRHE